MADPRLKRALDAREATIEQAKVRIERAGIAPSRRRARGDFHRGGRGF